MSTIITVTPPSHRSPWMEFGLGIPVPFLMHSAGHFLSPHAQERWNRNGAGMEPGIGKGTAWVTFCFHMHRKGGTGMELEWNRA